MKIPVEACLFSDTCGVNKVDQGFPLSAGALQPSGGRGGCLVSRHVSVGEVAFTRGRIQETLLGREGSE